MQHQIVARQDLFEILRLVWWLFDVTRVDHPLQFDFAPARGR